MAASSPHPRLTSPRVQARTDLPNPLHPFSDLQSESMRRCPTHARMTIYLAKPASVAIVRDSARPLWPATCDPVDASLSPRKINPFHQTLLAVAHRRLENTLVCTAPPKLSEAKNKRHANASLIEYVASEPKGKSSASIR